MSEGFGRKPIDLNHGGVPPVHNVKKVTKRRKKPAQPVAHAPSGA